MAIVGLMVRPKSYDNGNSGNARPPDSPPHDDQCHLWERERLFAAMVDEVAANGYEQTTIAAVTSRAGLPETSFEVHFPDLEGCFLETFDSLVAQVHAHALSSYRAQGEDWPASVRAAMYTLAHAISIHPAAASFCLLQAPTVSPAANARCDATLALLEDAIAQMLADAPGQPEPAPLIVAAIAGGIWHVLGARLRGDLTEEPPELADGLLAALLAHAPRATPNGTLPDGAAVVRVHGEY